MNATGKPSVPKTRARSRVKKRIAGGMKRSAKR
jgi:hypothetical protein